MLVRSSLLLAACVSPIALGACTQVYNETEGLTFGAGNSVAHNTALQMVDPWPNGVQDTNFAVPANRGNSADAGDGGGDGTAETDTAADD